MMTPNKTFFFWMLISLAFLFAVPFSSWARELFPGLQKVTFPNGLTAVVKESHRAPVVSVQVWVKAGSIYETDEEAGITHLIEHMIFKGTTKRGPGEMAREIESIGGTINAYTSLDYTVYHCTVPRQFLDTALDILSDALFHSTFDKNELEREKKVVLEEIRMREDRPSTRLSRLLMSTSYKVFPYRRPVIGFPETVRSFSRDDILNYMKRRYRPTHMAVIVVGDVDGTRTMARLKESFGVSEKMPPVNPEFPKEPAQKQPRISWQAMDTEEGYLALTFSGLPDFNSEDTPALDVLAALLGNGESSRLVQSLKNRLQLVHQINALAFTPSGPGLFEITATLNPTNTNEVISQILQEIFRLQNEEVLEEELERAKIQVETGFVYGQETMEGEAQKLGLFQIMTNDPYREKRYLEQIREVTSQDIQRLARKYFRRKNINVSMVLPEGQAFELTEKDILIMAQEAELQAQGIEGFDAASLVHPIKRTVLSNGLTVLIQEAPEVPTVAIRLVFPGGVRYETKELNGIFKYLSAAWTKGTSTHSAQGLAQLIEGMGGSISGFSGQNTFGLQARFLSQNLEKGLTLFAELILSPIFPTDEVEKLRPILLAQLKRQEDYLPGVAFREFRRLLFSPHPYGMNPLGTPETLQKISAEDIRRLYQEFALPDRGVLAVVGDVNTEEILSGLETLLGGWTSDSENVLPSLPAPNPLESPKFLTLNREKQQVHIVLGFPGTTFNDAERYPLDVLNAVLAGQGGRLFMNLRDKESLAYAVTSVNGLGLDYGSFAFYIACAPEKRKKAIKELWNEIYKIINRPVSKEELERAKKWLVGTYEIGLQTHGAQAMDMALNELYGLGFNFSTRYVQEIDKVTAEQVLEAARKFLDPDAYILVQVGPKK